MEISEFKEGLMEIILKKSKDCSPSELAKLVCCSKTIFDSGDCFAQAMSNVFAAYLNKVYCEGSVETKKEA